MIDEQLAACQANLGWLYGATDRPADGIQACCEALPIWQRLTREYPMVGRYRSDEARCYQELGHLYQRTGKPADAAKAWQEARRKWQDLVRDRLATGAAGAVALGNSYALQGTVALAKGDYQTAVEQLTQAVGAVESVLKKDLVHDQVRNVLRQARIDWANAFEHLGRHADALDDWDRALALVDDPDRDWIRAHRAATLARLRKHVLAVAEARALAGRDSGSGGLLYDSACVFALAVDAARQDTQLTQLERDRRAQEYGTCAVELLVRAKTVGYFRLPERVEELKNDEDLKSLRARADYQKLIRALTGKP
jgi:tetratricopeptide (TPR) repeat protein